MRAVCGKDAGEGQESTHGVEHIPNSGTSRSFADGERYRVLMSARRLWRPFVELAELADAVGTRDLQEILRQLDRLGLGFGLDDRETADHLLGFGEWAVVDRHLAVGRADARAPGAG